MKQSIVLLLFSACLTVLAQESSGKWETSLHLGHYPASLIVPSVDPVRPGIYAGILYQWNQNSKHRWIQSGNLGYFYHRSVQGVVQLYTEFGYELRLDNGLRIRPLMLGGGYVLAFSDMPSFVLDESSGQYETVALPIRHNWLISLGPSIGYESKLQLAGRPLSFFLDYRIQLQGIVVRSTSPFLAYAPVRVGLSVPMSK